MAELDFDKSGTVNIYEFDSNGETATANGEDDDGAQVWNLLSNNFFYPKNTTWINFLL